MAATRIGVFAARSTALCAQNFQARWKQILPVNPHVLRQHTKAQTASKLSITGQSQDLVPHFGARSLSSEAVASGAYSADLPQELVAGPRLKSFYEVFYNTADSSDAHEAYAKAFFTKDATFILGSRRAKGHLEICALREFMWTGSIKSRQHRLLRIFPFGNRFHEIMMYGTCTYGLWNGKEVPVEWSARASLAEEDGSLKMKYYQVYFDSVLITNAAHGDSGS